VGCGRDLDVSGGFWATVVAQRRAAWAALQDAGPVANRGGIYYVTRREDALAVLRDPETFSALAWRPGVDAPCLGPGGRSRW
jgi:cytochrome P450